MIIVLANAAFIVSGENGFGGNLHYARTKTRKEDGSLRKTI